MSRAVRYHVISKIAHGGMAEIFLAVQQGAEGFQKQVVLKRILPALAADPSFVRMLVDEAHIASTLNHSNLVQVLDLGKSGDQFFLVLEFVDGWSLEQARRRAQKARMKLPLPLSLYVVGALCRALAYVHTRKRNGRPLGIVHRDVTPQNVLLSREGEVKLADFGIAKAIGKTEKSATGVIKGKFAYMSPEQSIGGELDGRSDLFSVGTVLYLLATGRKPFEGTTDLDVLMQVRKARYEKPSALVRDFNPEVERFIARALRADRSRRWQSAEQMADRIDAILMKLGQTTGASSLKRWLENLSAKDGAKPPAELAEMSSASAIIELGSRDLELEEVSPSAPDARGAGEGVDELPDVALEVSTQRERPRGPLAPPASASPVGRGAQAATATGHAYADYGVEDAPDVDDDGGAGNRTAAPDGAQEDGEHEGAARTSGLRDGGFDHGRPDDGRPDDGEPDHGKGESRGVLAGRYDQRSRAENGRDDGGQAGRAPASDPAQQGSVTPSLRRTAAALRAADGPSRAALEARRRVASAGPSRAVRRGAILAATALLLAGGIYLNRAYLSVAVGRPIKAWMQQRLPVPVGGPDWTGDPRTPEENPR